MRGASPSGRSSWIAMLSDPCAPMGPAEHACRPAAGRSGCTLGRPPAALAPGQPFQFELSPCLHLEPKHRSGDLAGSAEIHMGLQHTTLVHNCGQCRNSALLQIRSATPRSSAASPPAHSMTQPRGCKTFTCPGARPLRRVRDMPQRSAQQPRHDAALPRRRGCAIAVPSAVASRRPLLDVAGQELAVEVVADGVVDESLLRLRLAAGLQQSQSP